MKVPHIFILFNFHQTKENNLLFGVGKHCLRINTLPCFHTAWSQFLPLTQRETDGAGDHGFHLIRFLIGGPEKRESVIVSKRFLRFRLETGKLSGQDGKYVSAVLKSSGNHIRIIVKLQSSHH